MPIKLSEAELVVLAKQAKSETFEDALEDVDVAKGFCKALGIKSGKNRVPAKVIYKLYCAWAEEPENHTVFFTQFARLHVKVRTKSYMSYLLNYKAKTLSEKAKEYDL